MPFVLKATLGIRVSAKEEIESLNNHKHKMHAYPAINAAGVGLGLHENSLAGFSSPDLIKPVISEISAGH